MPRADSIWSGASGAAIHADMKTLWHEGLSIKEIARRLRIPKNAVSGRTGRNRMDFPTRPDPIRRSHPRAPAKKPFAPLPRAAAAQRAPAPVLPVEPVHPVQPVHGAPCQYPTGDKPILFECEGHASTGLPYCIEHQRLTHVRERPRNPEQE